MRDVMISQDLRERLCRFEYAPHIMAVLTSTQVHITALVMIDLQVSFPVSTSIYFKRSPETIVTLL